MKKLIPILIIFIYFMVGAILILMPPMVSAKLSDETLKEVEKLRWKHYPLDYYFTQPDIEWWSQQYPYIKFEDGILYIVDGDITWFVEMEKVKEAK